MSSLQGGNAAALEPMQVRKEELKSRLRFRTLSVICFKVDAGAPEENDNSGDLASVGVQHVRGDEQQQWTVEHPSLDLETYVQGD